MTNMIDRSPAGRDTDEGFEEATADKTVRDLLEEILHELQQLRRALAFTEVAADLKDLD